MVSKVRMTTGFLNKPTVETRLNAAYLNVVSVTEENAVGQDKPIEGLG